jgi:tripartite-type tricarboxylate transporter receptor subunit TctC
MKSITFRIGRRLLIISGLLSPLIVPAAAAAETPAWPQRPVKVLVPFAAGGNIDVMGRLAAQRLTEGLGQQFVIENRVGGNGIIATEAVAKSPADGYTLLWASTSVITILPAISKVGYDPVKDLAPVSLFSLGPQALIVNPKMPVHTVQEFIAYIRSQKEKQPYAGGGGPGSASNLIMQMLLQKVNLEMIGVSYRGTAPALTDLIAGHIPAMFIPISEALPQAKAGLIRMLAVSSETRSQEAPDVPTIAESGFPGFNAVSWTGMMAPAATPRPIIDRMAAEIGHSLKQPAFIEQLRANGVAPAADASPEAFAAFIKREMPLWGGAARKAGVTLK